MFDYVEFIVGIRVPEGKDPTDKQLEYLDELRARLADLATEIKPHHHYMFINDELWQQFKDMGVI